MSKVIEIFLFSKLLWINELWNWNALDFTNNFTLFYLFVSIEKNYYWVSSISYLIFFKSGIWRTKGLNFSFFFFYFFSIRPLFRKGENTRRSRARVLFSSCKRWDTILRESEPSVRTRSTWESQFWDLAFLDSQEESIRTLFLGEPNQCSMRRCYWSEIDNKGKLMNHEFLYPSVPIGL